MVLLGDVKKNKSDFVKNVRQLNEYFRVSESEAHSPQEK